MILWKERKFNEDEKEKIRFKPLAAVVFVVILAAVMLASALISAKAAPLTWQDICNQAKVT